MLHEAGEHAALISEAASPTKRGHMASKQLGADDKCAVTSFVTVARNDLKTATKVMAFLATYNTSDSGDDDAPMPRNLNVSVALCGLQGATKTISSARIRRIDTAHRNPRGFWRANQDRVTYPTPFQVAQLEEASQLVDEPVSLTEADGCVHFSTTMATTATVVLDFQY